MDAVRAALLALVAILLMALAPQTVFAHDGERHHQAAVPDEQQAQTLSPELHAWAPSCPGAPAHACSCGNLTACEGSGQPTIAHHDRGRLLVSPRPEPRSCAGLFVPSSLAHSRARPRAPPSFS
jgi:hypothetical protein